MSEQRMVEIVESALERMDLHEAVLAAGQFYPRGHTGSMFAGGFIGSGVGGGVGGLADSIATIGGSVAGYKIHDAASGLPQTMLVGVTATHVFGFASPSRRKEAGALVFAMPRDDLDVKVHQRVNVRVLELLPKSGGGQIQLEGDRIPLTHSKDVIHELTQ